MTLIRYLLVLYFISATLPAGADSVADRIKNAFTPSAAAAQGDDEPLHPDKAFIITVGAVAPDTVRVEWQIAEGYYLYQDKFKFEITEGDARIDNDSIIIPPGKVKEDPSFGRVEVLYHGLVVDVPVIREVTNEAPVSLRVRYQGCKEDSICYPPIKKVFPVIFTGIVAPVQAATPPPSPAIADTAENTLAVSEQDAITQQLTDKGLLVNIAAFFGFGLLLSLTPCIFPMIPILSGLLIGTQGEKTSTLKGFTLSLSYVVAMALTYAVAGIIAAMINFNLQAASQNVWVISVFSLLFVLLALSMFGFYDIQLPSSWQTRLTQMSNSQESGRLVGAFVMGSLSAIIVGPCVAPPLAGALLYISQTGDQLLGGLALFALGMGMGVPLLVIGASAGSVLPRAGMWMEDIKKVFGVILIGVAIWFMGRIVPAMVELYLWGALLVVTAIYMGALDHLERTATWARFWKGVGIVILTYGIVLVIGASGGSESVLKPLQGLARTTTGSPASETGKLAFKTIKGLDELEAELSKASEAGKMVMLDFYADWCVACIEMETYTFPRPEVHAVLQDVILLKTDVTQNDDLDQALMNNFKIFGPPAILFFGTDAQELKTYRLIGFLEAEAFVEHVKAAISS